MGRCLAKPLGGLGVLEFPKVFCLPEKGRQLVVNRLWPHAVTGIAAGSKLPMCLGQT